MLDATTDSRAGTTIDLARLRRALRAARIRIGLAAGIAAALAAVAVGPTFDPSPIEIAVRIEPRSPRAATGVDALVAAQLELLGSDRVLRAVAETAPEAVDALEGDAPAAGRGTPTPKERRLAVLRERLSAERADRPDEILVRVRADDAETGAAILSAVLHRWSSVEDEDRERAVAEVERARTGEVEAARRRLESLRAAAAAASTAEQPEIVTLRSERDLAAARLKRLQTLAAAGSSGAERAVDEASTPVLRELRDRRGALRSRAAQLSTVYLANHPLMKELDADLADLRRRIAAELPRAVAAARADLAALDRRLADAAAWSQTDETAAAPLDAAEAELTAAEKRRDTAVAQARAETGVDLRRSNEPSAERPVSWLRAAAAAALAALATLLVALVGIARRAVVPTPVESNHPEVRDDATHADPLLASMDVVPMDVAMVDVARVDQAPPDAEAPDVTVAPVPTPAAAARPEVAAPVDRDAPARAERSRAAAAEMAQGLWPRLLEETGLPCRIVVASTRDAAWAHGTALALAEAIADDGITVGRVALDDVAPSRSPGLSDVLDGRVAFSAAIGRDRAKGVWTLTRGHRRIDEADRADPGLVSLLEALDATWDVVVVSVGRLDGGAGTARLLETADAVVMAEDVAVDARTVALVEALNEAGRPTWILDAAFEPSVFDWARAA